MKASLEAELGSVRSQLGDAAEEGVALRAQITREHAEADERVAAKEKEAASWKAKWKAQAATNADVSSQLEIAEKRLLEEAAAHAATIATKDGRIRELAMQLESGRPAEQQMFSLAREQAKRDEEVSRLRTQLKNLREMLRESHKVLKHLMQQEQLLKEELKSTRRSNELADTLNIEYLKNVVYAFLLKVYGDADNEEHIKLARVLETILHFSPEESSRLRANIEHYESSWWHTTSNFLKFDTAPVAEVAADGPRASATGSGSLVGSIWGSVFGRS